MKQQYNLRIDKDLLERLKDRAQTEGTKVTKIIEKATNTYLSTGTCIDCGAKTNESILAENSRYSAYGFNRICDNCGDKLERLLDEQQHER